MTIAFSLRTVVHLTRPWGTRVRTLSELRAGIVEASDDVLLRHAIQFPLRHPAADVLPHDDFSAWIATAAQDVATAERMAFALQSAAATPADTRAAALSALDASTSARTREHTVPEEAAFTFLAAESLVFATEQTLDHPRDVVAALCEEDAGVWFFHLVEEPWRTGHASLLSWLESAGGMREAGWLREALVMGQPIDRSRAHVLKRARRTSIARGVAAAADAPESERREAGRRALASLVRRAHPDTES